MTEMIEQLRAMAGPVAKAVAMFVAPFVLLFVGALVNAIGLDVAVPELDQWVTWITTFLVAAINAGVTWWVRNQPAPAA
jgi:cytochrome c biogenesis protein CcdA